MALHIECRFESPHRADAVWRELNDIEGVARCLPGASLEGPDGSGGWRGRIAVRLGPMQFAFKGQFRLAEVDPAARRAVASARGADDKGRGTVGARIGFAVAERGSGSAVGIESQIELAGMVAQFGRGNAMVQAVAQALVDAFARNLEAQMGAPVAPSQAGPAAAPVRAAATRPLSLWRLLLAALGRRLRRVRS